MTTSLPIVWTGYEIGLVDLCKKAKNDIPDHLAAAFQVGAAKLLIPESEQKVSIIANADISHDTCDRILRDQARYQRASMVFDTEISGFDEKEIKHVYFAVAKLPSESQNKEDLVATKDVGFIEVRSALVANTDPTPLYLNFIRLGPLKNGTAILRQGVGTAQLATSRAGGKSTILCDIVVRKDRITTVKVSALNGPPRCECENNRAPIRL